MPEGEEIQHSAIRTDFKERSVLETRVDKQWSIVTEQVRRQLSGHVGVGKDIAIKTRDSLAPLVTVSTEETLPLIMMDKLVEEGATTKALEDSLERSRELKEYLRKPPIPEEKYAFYMGLQKGKNPTISEDERVMVLRRSTYARETKILALGADILSTKGVDFKNASEFVTTNGARIRINPEFTEIAGELVDTSNWQYKLQTQDRVNVVTINGKEYILKEQKTKRHKNVASDFESQLSFGNTAEIEFDQSMQMNEEVEQVSSSTEIEWEKPVAWVGFPDQEGYQIVLFEKVQDAMDAYAPNLKERRKISGIIVNRLRKTILDNFTHFEQEFDQAKKLIKSFKGRKKMTKEAFASAKAARWIHESEWLFTLVQARLGYANQDHKNKDEFIYSIDETKGKPVLKMTGIDLEWVMKTKQNVLEPWVLRNVKDTRKSVKNKGLITREEVLLECAGLNHHDEAINAFGKVLGFAEGVNVDMD